MAQTSKAFPYSSFIVPYAFGLGISNDATTPNTQLDVAVGSILDSTKTFQISLSSPAVINAATVGLNGIDKGALAASTVYAVLLVADPVTQQPSGCIISLSSTAPLLPFGYSAFALIGYVTTDASAHFLKGYWSAGNDNSRQFTYDAPIICLTAGAATTYTGIALTAFVPAVDGEFVTIYSNFTANAAGNVQNIQGYNSTGDAVTNIAAVAGATAHTTDQNIVIAQLNAGAPSIKYKITAGTVSMYVCGYSFGI